MNTTTDHIAQYLKSLRTPEAAAIEKLLYCFEHEISVLNIRLNNAKSLLNDEVGRNEGLKATLSEVCSDLRHISKSLN